MCYGVTLEAGTGTRRHNEMAKKKTAKAKTARKRAVKDLAPKKNVKGGMASKVDLRRYE